MEVQPHIITVLPYALLATAIASFGFLVVGPVR